MQKTCSAKSANLLDQQKSTGKVCVVRSNYSARTGEHHPIAVDVLTSLPADVRMVGEEPDMVDQRGRPRHRIGQARPGLLTMAPEPALLAPVHNPRNMTILANPSRISRAS